MNQVTAVVLLIGILVFVHEFGHFIVGKLFGFGVETFSIGFGPRLLGFRKSGTDYRFSIIPLGGYVKFAGSVPSEPVPERFKGQEIYKKPIWQRALMTFAGPFANLLLAILAYTYLGGVGIQHEAPVVGQVRPGGAAEKAGLVPGDRFVSIDGKAVEKWTEMVEYISASGGQEVTIEFVRGKNEISKRITPEFEEVEDLNGDAKKVGRIGISHGFLPSKIAVKFGSIAANLQLKTGMQVEKVGFNEGSIDVKTFHELASGIGAGYRENAAYAMLSVIAKGEDSGNSSKTFKVPFDLIESEGEFESNYQLGKSILSKLGIFDTSLTVAEVPAKFKDSKVKKGDLVVSIAGKSVSNIFDLQYFLIRNKNPSVNVGILRSGVQYEHLVKLDPVEVQKAKGKDIFFSFPAQFMGERIRPEPYVEKYDGLISSLWFGISRSIKLSGEIVGALIGLMTGEVPLGALGGPMLIAKVAGDSAALGLAAYLSTLAIISINLCMINLFPIPVLDGGQLVMLAAEKIKGSALSEAGIENYQKVGFVMVMGLILLSTYNDLGRFWASMLRTVGGAQ